MKKSFSVMVAIVLIASMSLLAFAACVTDDETDDHPNMEYVSAVDATCVEDGNIEYWYCPDCGKYFSDEMGEQEITLDDTVIAATGEHDWGEWVTDSESSCTVGGTRHRICVDCGERQDGTLPVGDHDLNFVNAVDATCTNGGNIAYWHCSECGNNYSDEEATEVLNDVTTPKAAHDMTYVAAQAHTCTNDGNIEYWHCSACGYNFADEDGEQELESVVDPAAHTWGEWEQTSDPTCTERGVLTRVCEVCFDEEYDYIDELGHDFEGAEWAYNDANHWNLCNRCGAESERADHEFNNGVCFCGALAPTETSEFWFVPLDNGTMKLAYYRGDDASVVIPTVFQGKSVTEISENAFIDKRELQTIVIPSSINVIGEYAFAGCSALIDVTIEKGVETIESCAFESCCSLTNIDIPDSVTSIGSRAFYNCNGLTSITIGNSVTSIGDYAFYGCSGLTSITIPDSVTSIGSSAFEDCSGLTSITIPDSVTSIGSSAFEDCSGLTSIDVEDGNPVYHSAGNCIIATESKTLIAGCKSSVIPNDGSVTSIGYEAFYNCSGLTSIVIPDSVTSIGDLAFYGCSGLTSVVIPDSVTIIGEEAFLNCSSLTSVTIGNGVTSIGENAFYGCTGLTDVYYQGDLSGWLGIEFGGYNSNPMEYADNRYINGQLLQGDIVIPEGTAKIGDYAFYNCSSLTSVTIPDGVTSIGYGAFYNCSGLTSIVIPDSVTSIGSSAFSWCTSLRFNEYGDAKYLGNAANPYLVLYDVTDTSVTSFEIMAQTKFIYNHAFSGCSGLTSITIPDSVTSIGDYAFRGCSSLTSVTIPDSVTSIGDYAFYECSGLTSITIPDSVTSIGDYAFYECSGLTSVTIGNGVTSIGWSAFDGCSDLTAINFQGTMAQWQAIEKDIGWDYSTGEYAVICTDGTISKADA